MFAFAAVSCSSDDDDDDDSVTLNFEFDTDYNVYVSEYDGEPVYVDVDTAAKEWEFGTAAEVSGRFIPIEMAEGTFTTEDGKTLVLSMTKSMGEDGLVEYKRDNWKTVKLSDDSKKFSLTLNKSDFE